MFLSNEERPDLKGKLIIIEGADGCGKSTVTETILQTLLDQGIDAVQINVLQGNPISLALRKIVTDVNSVISPEVEAALYSAAVRHCYESQVIPLLKEGRHVVLDRGPQSTMVYQGMWGRHQSNLTPSILQNLMLSTFTFDHFILVTCPLELATRLLKSRGQLDRIESRPDEFHRFVRQEYLSLFRSYSCEKSIVENNGTYDALIEKARHLGEHIADLL